MRELLSHNSLFVGQLSEDKSLVLRTRDMIFFTTDLQTVNHTKQFTARADLFLMQKREQMTIVMNSEKRVNIDLYRLEKKVECHLF